MQLEYNSDLIFSGNKDFKLTLTWTDPKDDGENNDLSLSLVPAYHNGSKCTQMEDDDLLLAEHGGEYPPIVG